MSAALAMGFAYLRVSSWINLSAPGTETRAQSLGNAHDAPLTRAPAPKSKDATRTSSPPVVDDEIETKLRALSLSTKVGQLFIVGFVGAELENGLAASIKANQPGAIVVFGRNIKSAEQVARLTRAAQIASLKHIGLPLLIAVDQEGGNVIRIRTAPPLPSALALGELGDEKLVTEAGVRTGRLLRRLGFNMNLAPVMDIADASKDKFIGTRTYGDDPEHVTRMSSAFAKGLESSDVLPTGKHFPGHGGLNADSHLGTPVKRAPLDEMLKRDLVPFSAAAKRIDASAIMVAHVAYPELDPSGMPATFSRPIVTDLLRGRLGFQGLVLTDDIEMAGASAIRDPGERAVRAIEAGADLVMIGWNKKMQHDLRLAVFKAVRSKRIPESRINESVRRILRAKSRYVGFQEPPPPDRAAISEALQDSELRAIAIRTLRSKFAVAAKRKDSAYFEEHSSAPIILFSSLASFATGFQKTVPDRSVQSIPLALEAESAINRAMRVNPDAVGVFYVSGPRTALIANALSADVASRIVLVNSEARGAIAAPERFRQVVDVSFRHASTGSFTAQTFFKPSTTSGELRTPATSESKPSH